MSSNFDDLMADCNPAFTDAFGEDVAIVYRPRGSGTPRPITAIIDYLPPEPTSAGQPGVSPVIIIDVENDATRGITAAEFDASSDRVDVPLVSGGALKTRNFKKRIVSQDGGRIRLQVE